jgi:hypothetical protein
MKSSPLHDLIKEQPPAKSLPRSTAELLLCSAGLSAPRAAPGHSLALEPPAVGSQPLRLRWIHTPLGYQPLSRTGLQSRTGHTPRQDPCPSAMLPDPRPPGFLPPICTGPQPRAGPTAHLATQTPEPTALQALLSPSYVWNNWSPTSLG